jgi:hypothetical protein
VESLPFSSTGIALNAATQFRTPTASKKN